jgi:biopolymer transport protein TolR
MPRLEPMQNTSSRAAGGRRARPTRVSSSLAEINVVPLVDVMLVLLVIFMVAAPMMQQGFPVNLPQSSRSQAIPHTVTITVPATFGRDGRVRLGKEAVRLEVLSERVKQELANQSSRQVVVAADGAVTVQQLLSVFDKLKEGGVDNVGIQSQPLTGRQP